MRVSTATIKRDEVVRRALRRIGVPYPNVTQINAGVALLHDVIKEIDMEGRWLWAINPTPSTFNTVSGQRSYGVGGAFQYARIALAGSIGLQGALNPEWSDEFTISFLVKFDANAGVSIGRLDGARGFSISMDTANDEWSVYFGHDGVNFIAKYFSMDGLPSSGWRRVTVAYDGSGLSSGFSAFIDAAELGEVNVPGSTTDNLGPLTTVAAGGTFGFSGNPESVAQLAVYSASLLSAAQLAELGGAGARDDMRTLSSEPLLTNYFPMAGDSNDVVGGVNGDDTNVTYPTSQSNGISDNLLRLEWAEVVQGTSRKPLRIIYEQDALATVFRETGLGGEPYMAFLQPDAVMARQRVHLFPTPSAVFRVDYNFRRRIFDFVDANSNPDMPQDWAQRLVKKLSYELAPEFRVPLEERVLLKSEADEAMHKGLAANEENATPAPRPSQYF